MTNLLTNGEAAEALAHGWKLCDVFDLDLKRWLVLVLPAVIGQSPQYTPAQALKYVIGWAKQGHPLSLKALRLVVNGPAPKPSKRKKK